MIKIAKYILNLVNLFYLFNLELLTIISDEIY